MNLYDIPLHPYFWDSLIWERELAGLTDEELIENHNNASCINAWGCYRAAYMKCFRKELLSRNMDSSILFEFDENGKWKTYHNSQRVRIQIVNGRKILMTAR